MPQTEAKEPFYLDLNINSTETKIQRIYQSPPPTPKFYACIISSTLCILCLSERFKYSKPNLSESRVEITVVQSDDVYDENRFFTFPLLLSAFTAITNKGLEWVINGKTLGRQDIVFVVTTSPLNATRPVQTQTKKNPTNFFHQNFWEQKDVVLSQPKILTQPLSFCFFSSSNTNDPIVQFEWNGNKSQIFSAKSFNESLNCYQIDLPLNLSAALSVLPLKLKDEVFWKEVTVNHELNIDPTIEVSLQPYQMAPSEKITVQFKSSPQQFAVDKNKFLFGSNLFLSSGVGYNLFSFVANRVNFSANVLFSPEMEGKFFSYMIVYSTITIQPVIKSNLLIKNLYAEATGFESLWLNSTRLKENNKIQLNLDLFASKKISSCTINLFTQSSAIPNNSPDKRSVLILQLQLFFNWKNNNTKITFVDIGTNNFIEK